MGFWRKNHARVFNELDPCNLVAVTDINAERARAIGEKYRVDWDSDSLKLLKGRTIEFISICTPTITHAKLALEANKAGKHVIVELESSLKTILNDEEPKPSGEDGLKALKTCEAALKSDINSSPESI